MPSRKGSGHPFQFIRAMTVAAFRWQGHYLNVLDQRLLPRQIKTIRCETPTQVAKVIRTMAVRGAPAIGCCAAYGMVLAARARQSRFTPQTFLRAGRILRAALPTAVNLAWAVERMRDRAADLLSKNPSDLFTGLLREAKAIESADVRINRSIGKWGAGLFKAPSVILTHCNTGALATAGFGTALGVIRELQARRKLKKVFVGETRPYLQGARLTAWELRQDHIPHELITDGMAGHFMKKEKIHGVIVGCDRVAANGDTANKIGTYGLAVLARYHKIPFYVAMPTSTLDLSLGSGDSIPIEERSSEEVVKIGGQRIAPAGTAARHPAFDVTPSELVTAIITEFGIVRPPFKTNLKKLAKRMAASGLF